VGLAAGRNALGHRVVLSTPDHLTHEPSFDGEGAIFKSNRKQAIATANTVLHVNFAASGGRKISSDESAFAATTTMILIKL
jgi:hypothetical protein